MDDIPPCKRQREPEIVKNERPRRNRVPVLRKSHSLHDLVPLIAASSSMPMVIVDAEAMMIMSLHSHLCSDEIIGWMAGTIDPDSIHIQKAFPVKALAHENGRINVEMDVENALTVRTEIEEIGLKIVGWYHSHPTFEVTPSLMDIDNQINYQDISTEYFLGGIISPYMSTHKLEGLFTIFHVKKNKEEHKRNGYHPAYSIKFNVQSGEISQKCIDFAMALINDYKEHKKFIVPSKKWKKGLTIAQKISKALEYFGLTVEQISQIYNVLI